MRAWVLVAMLLVGCGVDNPSGIDGGIPDAAPAYDAGFVPTVADFQGFTTWARVDLGSVSAGGHPEAPVQHAYYNLARPPGSRTFLDGTIIIRSTEAGTPTQWPLFAMARRGGDYNAAGDVGWEFFRLAIESDGRVDILARGLAPTLPSDDPYALGEGVTCNSCHGLPDARQYDGVLDPELRPPDP